jgi:hypothetical protein
MISSRMVGGKLQIVRDPVTGAPKLPGATATQENGNQIQLPDGTWIDPSAMMSAGSGKTAAQQAPAPSLAAKPVPPRPMGAAPAPVVATPPPGGVALPEIAVAPAPPAPAVGVGANAGGGMMRKPLGEFYQGLERERGLPEGFLARTRAIESANGTNLANPNSSARGDFQFIRSTAKQYGIDPMDPYASAKAAADMAQKNMQAMQAKGITPDGADLYAAHQQGLGGYLKLRSGQSSGGAEMALNGGAGKSPGAFLASWRDKFNNAKPANLGEGFVPNYPAGTAANAGQGPTVANAAAQPAQPAPAPVPEAPKPPPYTGGVAGLFGDGPTMPKLEAMAQGTGAGSFAGFGKAIAGLAAPQQQDTRPGITIQANTEAHAPDPSLMAYLDPRRRRMMGA